MSNLSKEKQFIRTLEQAEERLFIVQLQEKEFNKELSNNDKQIKQLKIKNKKIAKKISSHMKYMSQLEDEIKSKQELVTEPSKPERIKVLKVDNYRGKDIKGYWHQFVTDKEVWFDKFPAIKQAIENVLNDTVVEDKADITNEGLGKLMMAFHNHYKDYIPKSEVDAMMEKVWNASREASTYFYNAKTGAFCGLNNPKYSMLQDYKAILPLQQVQEPKFKIGDVVTKINGTLKMTVEGYGYRDENNFMPYPINKAVQVVYFRRNGKLRRITLCEDKLMLYTEQQVQEDIRDNKINLLEEDLAVVHHYLDDLSMPRKNDGGDAYSIVGRIKQLELYYMKKLSEIESEYLQKLQPKAKDKPFIWTDALVEEYKNTYYHWEEGQSNLPTIEQFKQSKQSPTNLQESKEEKHKCKFCGAWTSQDDKYCYKNPYGITMNDFTQNHSTQPQPSTTVKDKQEWEIVTCFDNKISEYKETDWHYYIPKGDKLYISNCEDDNCKIRSVLRKSDNTVFSIGDKVDDGMPTLASYAGKSSQFYITDFSIEGGNLFANGSNIKTLTKLPTPNTDTISTNNDDVCILSLNDLQKVWFTKDEQVQFGKFEGIPMYRRFKDLVKQKLKQQTP